MLDTPPLWGVAYQGICLISMELNWSAIMAECPRRMGYRSHMGPFMSELYGRPTLGEGAVGSFSIFGTGSKRRQCSFHESALRIANGSDGNASTRARVSV